MKYLLLLLPLAAYGQGATGQLCWYPDKTVTAKAACIDVGPAAKKALRDWSDTQTDAPTPPATAPVPRYAGLADLIFSHFAALLSVAVDNFPSNAMLTDRATAAAGTAAAEAKKAAIINKQKVADPQ